MDDIEVAWTLFPLAFQYFKKNGLVYDGAGRWTRSNQLFKVLKDHNEFILEVWLTDGNPKLIERHFLKDNIEDFYGAADKMVKGRM